MEERRAAGLLLTTEQKAANRKTASVRCHAKERAAPEHIARVAARATAKAEAIGARSATAAAKASARLHNAHVNAWKKSGGGAAWYRHRYHTIPEFMLKERLRRQLRKKGEAVPGFAELIRAAIKRDGDASTIERITGYTIRDLRRHLERQFVGTMSWASWSREGWHIDHIMPKKYFDLTTIDGVRAYWALPNLRPLWARDNMAKSAKREFLV